jgi:hypothetical protein
MVQGPYKRVTVITPHDTNPINVPCEALIADTGGTVNVVDWGGVTSTITLATGVPFEFAPRIVKTGGAAIGIKALCR